MKELVRKMGITRQTFYRWKKGWGYGGLASVELRRLKQLAAGLSLDRHVLQEVLSKSSEACPEAPFGFSPGIPLRGLLARFLVLFLTSMPLGRGLDRAS